MLMQRACMDEMYSECASADTKRRSSEGNRTGGRPPAALPPTWVRRASEEGPLGPLPPAVSASAPS